jgi:hypothetical protein
MNHTAGAEILFNHGVAGCSSHEPAGPAAGAAREMVISVDLKAGFVSSQPAIDVLARLGCMPDTALIQDPPPKPGCSVAARFAARLIVLSLVHAKERPGWPLEQ